MLHDAELGRLQRDNAQLWDAFEALHVEIDKLRAENESLKAEMARLVLATERPDGA